MTAPRAGWAPPPLLSLLIPAYNRPAGVARIFERLQPLRGSKQIEVLVSDDSSDDAAALAISALCAAFPGAVYCRQTPPLGAVANWNFLLDQARGSYSWLLHHDEAPADGAALAAGLSRLAPARFRARPKVCDAAAEADASDAAEVPDAPDALAALDAPDAPDIWVLACHVVHRPGAAARLHFPPRWGAAVLRRWPACLLQRNLIGPPSALIVRSRCYARFEPRLAWLVDVECYLRSRQAARGVAAWPGPGVVSYVDRQGSITAALRPRLAATAKAERAWLGATAASRPAGGIWLSNAPLASLLRGLEPLLWAAWRLGQALWQWLGGRRW